VVGTLIPLDAEDGAEFTYELVDESTYPDNLSFEIAGDQLKSEAIFNYEVKDSYTIRVRAIDKNEVPFDQTLTVTINNVNDPFTLNTITYVTPVNEMAPMTFTASVTDEDEHPQPVTFSLAVKEPGGDVPDDASIDASTGVFTWTPSEIQGPGDYQFDVVADDGEFLDYQTIRVHVNEVNVAPVLQRIPSPVTIDEMVPWTFTAVATDTDVPENTLTFELKPVSGTTFPTGATINPETGVFTWTPSEEQGQGSYSFRVRACDNGNPQLCDGQKIDVTVSEVNVAPVLAPIGNQEVGPLRLQQQMQICRGIL